MVVSRAMIDRLSDHDVSVVFGIPGTQTLPLNQALAEDDSMDYVMARHETAVTHQAWGYNQTSGEMAATLVVPGPGDMNAMNGLKNALNDCAPLLHISIETDPEVRGGDGIHETPPDTYDNVVKENILVETPESSITELDRAISIARTPPKGPVRLGIPRSFLKQDADITAQAGSLTTDRSTSLPKHSLDEVVSRLGDADRPVIVAGGGMRAGNASSQLQNVAELLSAPVFVTTKGKGVFPEDHDLFAGVLWGGASGPVQDCLSNADATFAVGTDLDAVSTAEWSIDLPNLIHITLGGDDLGGHHDGYEPVQSVVGEAEPVLNYLNNSVNTSGGNGPERAKRVREREANIIEPLRNKTEKPVNSIQALDAIRESLPRDAIVTADAGGSRLWTVLTFDVYDADKYVNPGSWASMGLGLPAAIGAKVANPDLPVVSVIGDGGLMMCLHELHTMATESIPVVVVVLNNADYAIISDGATEEFGLEDHGYGWLDTAIDFEKVADGLQVETYSATTHDEIATSVREAVDAGKPAVIEVPTDPAEPQAASWMGAED